MRAVAHEADGLLRLPRGAGRAFLPQVRPGERTGADEAGDRVHQGKLHIDGRGQLQGETSVCCKMGQQRLLSGALGECVSSR